MGGSTELKLVRDYNRRLIDIARILDPIWQLEPSMHINVRNKKLRRALFCRNVRHPTIVYQGISSVTIHVIHEKKKVLPSTSFLIPRL